MKEYSLVNNVETFNEALSRVRKAQEMFSTYTQEEVDKIFTAAAMAANQHRIDLAKLAVEETGMGVEECSSCVDGFYSDWLGRVLRQALCAHKQAYYVQQCVDARFL